MRWVLAWKGLAWRSVEIPVTLPKPALAALAGGYQRTPVLQLGADLWLDTWAALDTLDRLAPSPPLEPPPLGAAHRLLAMGAVQGFGWAVGAALGPAARANLLPEAFWQDRRQRFGLERERFAAMAPHLAGQHGWQLAQLGRALADGRAFLGGQQPGRADFALAMLVHFGRAATTPAVADWLARVEALGAGPDPAPMTAEEALEAARAARPAPVEPGPLPAGSEETPAPGARVGVAQEGCADPPVEGELVLLDAERIVLAHTLPNGGRVHLHLPLLGQIVRAG